jgi:spore maturation protein CgeB
MLCEYSDEMSRLFVENREVVFFRNKYELLEKIVFYLNNPDLRNEIAKNGYEKVQSYKHEVNDRIEIILSEFESIKL